MNGDMGFGELDMNARQVIATGIVAAMLGLGPMIASAQEGPYFGLFYGKASNDISQSDLNSLVADITVGIGGTNPTGSSDINDMDSIWGAQVGYRFNRFVAAEAGYIDLGKAAYTANLVSNFGIGNESYQARGRFLSSGPTVAVLGILPLGQRFDLYGRGGIYFADTRFRVRFVFSDGIASAEEKAGTQEFFGGLGFAWNISSDYAVRAELSHFLDVGDDDRTGEASVTTLGIGFVFR
jgi:OmpA-OmpF porin, OOP family